MSVKQAATDIIKRLITPGGLDMHPPKPTTVDIIKRMLKRDDYGVGLDNEERKAILRAIINNELPKDVFMSLSMCAIDIIEYLIIINPNTPKSVLRRLHNPDTRSHPLSYNALDMTFIANKNTPLDVLLRIYRSNENVPWMISLIDVFHSHRFTRDFIFALNVMKQGDKIRYDKWLEDVAEFENERDAALAEQEVEESGKFRVDKEIEK